MTVYYGLTEKESKLSELIYKKNKFYDNKAINLSLKDLKKFIIDNKLEKIIMYYTKISLDNFELNEDVYKDEKYNMIAVKLPFKFKINKVYKINWRKLWKN